MALPPPNVLRRVFLLVMVLSAALVAEKASKASAGAPDDSHWGFPPKLTSFPEDGGLGTPLRTCDRSAEGCVEPGGEEEMQMESEAARRVLADGGRYISYGALKKDGVPCNVRGKSYYNCRRSGKANPYHRGCSVITKCKRIID